MKKWLAVFCCITALFAAVGCDKEPSKGGNSGQNSSQGSSQSSVTVHTHADGNGNGYCDECDAIMHDHADEDENGLCDVCEGTVETTFDLYSINDLHGKFDDTYANGGVDEMTTYLRAAQENNPNTILISAGDMWQGSAESNFTKGKMITEWMNDLGFVSMTMGNHEYDWGESYIENNAELADFPFLRSIFTIKKRIVGWSIVNRP